MVNAWTTTQSGLWTRSSDNADSPWYDAGTQTARAAVPADGDGLITVAAQHVLTYDDDHGPAGKNFATGINAIVCTGHATTPGMLEFATGASAYLRMQSLKTISGTLATLRGRFKMGGGTWASPAALSTSYVHVVEFLGTAGGQFAATNLDIKGTCTEPANLTIRIYGTLFTGATGSASGDTITYTAHGLTNNTAIALDTTGGGALPAPLLPNALFYVKNQTANTFQLTYYLGGPVIDLTSDGSGTIRFWTGFASTSTKVITVLDDVTGDTLWNAASAPVSIVNLGASTYAQQRDQIATSGVAAGTITINNANNDAARSPTAVLTLRYRNMRVLANYTAGYIVCSGGSGNLINLTAEICSVAGTGTTYYGYAFSGCTLAGNTVGGVISGFSSSGAFTGCSNMTISAVLVSNGAAFSSCTSNTYSGLTLGCSTGFSSCTGGEMSGTVAGCTTAFSSCQNVTVTGTTKNSSIGFSSCLACKVSGPVYSDTTAFSLCAMTVSSTVVFGHSSQVFNASKNDQFSGHAYGSAYGFQGPGHLEITGGMFDQMGSGDVNLIQSRVFGYGAGLNSTTQFAGYLYSSYPDSFGRYGCWIIDAKDATGTIQTGTLLYCTAGGYGKSIAYSAGTHGTPPVTLTWVHTCTFQDANAPVYIDIPIWLDHGPNTFKIYVKAVQTTWTANPTAQLIDPDVEWGNAAEVLKNPDSAFTDDTNWQTLTLSYTPAYPRLVYLRVRATRGSGTLYWNWEKVNTVGGGARGYLALAKETGANARGGSGTCAKLTPASTTQTGYWSFYVPCPTTNPFTLSFWHKIASGFNGTLKCTIYDTDQVTVKNSSESVSLTDDGAYHQFSATSVTPASTGFCLVQLEIIQGAHSMSDAIYVDDVAAV